jgi:hypothetical protein
VSKFNLGILDKGVPKMSPLADSSGFLGRANLFHDTPVSLDGQKAFKGLQEFNVLSRMRMRHIRRTHLREARPSEFLASEARILCQTMEERSLHGLRRGTAVLRPQSLLWLLEVVLLLVV